jgi:hypothetical protein
MIKNITKIAVAAASLLGCALITHADDVAVTLKAGTLGVGLDLSAPVVPDSFNLRVNGNYFQYSETENLSNVAYKGTLKFNTDGLLADWYPFPDSFRVSVGGYYNNNQVSATGTPNGADNYVINGTTYTAAQIGSLTGKATLGNSAVPYAGIGWGNAVKKNSRWSFACDLGVLFTGSPKYTLISTGGTLSSNATFQANLAAERAKEQNSINFANVYPVVDAGVAYKF